jgi:hypothetical protein
MPGAPSFDQSISQFREAFNNDNPKLQLNEFRAIDSARDTPNLTRAASKINENLYASTALERGTMKIKSMQLTWLSPRGRSMGLIEPALKFRREPSRIGGARG